ncbi:GmrSD restriction endonuclease domain-containing protein [Laspinema palackyanum]|uniref:GmrSD restriction endonuclease domain-containing protein n=1 Tax=Laspinema palackyanum TaxID=3231601 RepID=UPI00345D0D20|nr:DUF262 domain-containing protein [Laspinema sp. D2c]
MADDYLIPNLIQDVERGKIRIPSFQRGFVWDPDRVLYFIDSIYKGFPFGSVLIWTTRNPLKTEKNLGPYKLPDNKPEYPLDYVLDGQQRITSIFGVFQNSLSPEQNGNTDWTNLFFEFNSSDSVPFKYLDDYNNYDRQKYFPLKCVFDPTRLIYAMELADRSLFTQISDLAYKFQKARIPVARFENEEPKYVATVFERINRQGVELNTFQLLSVWNWSEDFDLQDKFREVDEELEQFGFEELGSDLLLKCCSAVVKQSVNPEDFMKLPGNEVSMNFDKIRNAILTAIDFLEKELNIFSLKMLPMDNILPVLALFFAFSENQLPSKPNEQYEAIKRWFWRACFSRRYAKGGAKSTSIDLAEVQKMKDGKPHKLGDFDVSLDTSFFLKNYFRMSTVITNTFVLLLAEQEPLNFLQGTKISLRKVLSQANRKEFHHIFPRSFLRSVGISDNDINCLANLSILARNDNNRINNSPPNEYRISMPSDPIKFQKIMSTHFCPIEPFLENDYNRFLERRAELLLQKAKELCDIK